MTVEEAINYLIDKEKANGLDTNKIRDGYHTFGELYEHRIILYITLCKFLGEYLNLGGYETPVWRSKKHSDGELAYGGGWFVLGIYYNPKEQITYHLPESKWDECFFAKTLEKAPEFDGHTSADVLERLKNL